MAKTAEKKKAAPKDEPKVRRARPAAKLTMSQTKVLEAQFDTRLKDVTALDGKLVEIEDKFEEKDAFVPAQVGAAREKLAQALVLIGESKDEFAKIGEQYRTFFG